MNTPQPGSALATQSRVLVPQVISSSAEFKQSLSAWQGENYHILTPQADFGSLPPQWSIVPSIVKLDPNPDAGDVYKDNLFCKGDEVAPTKLGLRKIARGGGLSWSTVREDSGHVPNYWSMKCTIAYRGFDGQIKTAEASYEWDLRDGSARIANMAAKELSRARLNGYRRCEAGAINAAIREYGLKQKYTTRELAKPFVVLNMVFNPDMNDPQQKQAMLQSALSNQALLGYPPADSVKAIASGKGEGDIVGSFGPNDPVVDEDVPFSSVTRAAETTEPALTVKDVRRVGQSFYVLTEETGATKLHTDNIGVAQAADAARIGNKKVHIVTEQDDTDGSKWIVELREAASEPKL